MLKTPAHLGGAAGAGGAARSWSSTARSATRDILCSRISPRVGIASLSSLRRIGRHCAGESLAFALWNPNRSPGAFRFATTIIPAEFGAGGTPVEVTRTLHVGPANGNLGMLLRGGWKGLGLAGIRFEPLSEAVFLESIRSERLVYTTAENGRATVRLLNGGTNPVSLRLIVELEAGLGQPVVLHDDLVAVPPTAGSNAHALSIDFPPQPEYGHQVARCFADRERTARSSATCATGSTSATARSASAKWQLGAATTTTSRTRNQHVRRRAAGKCSSPGGDELLGAGRFHAAGAAGGQGRAGGGTDAGAAQQATIRRASRRCTTRE